MKVKKPAEGEKFQMFGHDFKISKDQIYRLEYLDEDVIVEKFEPEITEILKRCWR